VLGCPTDALAKNYLYSNANQKGGLLNPSSTVRSRCWQQRLQQSALHFRSDFANVANTLADVESFEQVIGGIHVTLYLFLVSSSYFVFLTLVFLS